jgi:ABC-type siderophore export system fused ATPase/permease subunit
MVVRAVLIWCALLVIASINGFAREAVLIPRIGDVAGRAVSSLALSVFIIILTWISIAWIAPRSTPQAWVVGVIWVALTLAFEFLAGHYVFHNSWSRLLEDYNLLRGRIWILVLVTTLVSPRICVGLRTR